MKQEQNSSDKKQTIFLKGKKTILRPLGEEGDTERCHRWINDSEVVQYLAGHWPVTLLEEKEWVEGGSLKTKNKISLAIVTHEGVHIGNMGADNINWIDGVTTTGAVIGDKAYWGKGLGTDAKMQLLNYFFNTLNLRKICSSVIAFNERSVAYSLKCGYKEEGRLRKHVFRNGTYHDLIRLVVFKEDWLPFWEKYNQQ